MFEKDDGFIKKSNLSEEMYAFVNSPSHKMPGVVEYILWNYIYKSENKADSIILMTLANDMKTYDFNEQSFNKEI